MDFTALYTISGSITSTLEENVSFYSSNLISLARELHNSLKLKSGSRIMEIWTSFRRAGKIRQEFTKLDQSNYLSHGTYAHSLFRANEVLIPVELQLQLLHFTSLACASDKLEPSEIAKVAALQTWIAEVSAVIFIYFRALRLTLC